MPTTEDEMAVFTTNGQNKNTEKPERRRAAKISCGAETNPKGFGSGT
jgi:hypothetical protein